MSINTNYPNVRPSLLLDFANSQQLDPRVTFSRSTTAPYYDGKTSVLAEQNLQTYSQTFTNGVWYTTTTVTANTTTAPDGTTTASTLLTPAGSNIFYIGQTTAITNAIPYTYSASLKYNTNQFAFIKIYGNTGTGSWGAVVVDLINGTITSTQNGSSATVNATSIVAQANGFYRVSITVTQSGGSATSGCGGFIQLSNTGTPSIGPYGNYTWTAVGTESIYIWGSQLEQRSSVTAYNATTTTAITNYIPQLLTAPINAPRFDFNPTTGESLGLLIEQSSTNLLTYSQLFSDSTWVKIRSSITQTAGIAPDGTQTAQLLIEDTTVTNSHGCGNYGSQTITSGQQYTWSVEAKAWTRNYITLSGDIGNGWLGNGVQFSLIDGTVQKNSSALVTTSTNLGNGWWRFSITATASASGNAKPGVYIGSVPATGASNGVDSYTGNGYSGIYIWGAQLEALAFPTSYIATTSAQVTRASDVPPKTTSTNFTQWFNYQQGTIYCAFDTPTISSSAPNMAIWGIDNGTTAQYYVNKSTATISGYEGTNNASFGTITANTNQLSIYTYSNVAGSSSASGLLNGGSIGTITATTQSILPTQLTIGGYITTSNQFTGHIKKLAFYPQAVTSAQLQALTGS